MENEIESAAIAYWNAIYSAPDGWGRHKVNGEASHGYLYRMQLKYGQSEFNAALDRTRPIASAR